MHIFVTIEYAYLYKVALSGSPASPTPSIENVDRFCGIPTTVTVRWSTEIWLWCGLFWMLVCFDMIMWYILFVCMCMIRVFCPWLETSRRASVAAHAHVACGQPTAPHTSQVQWWFRCHTEVPSIGLSHMVLTVSLTVRLVTFFTDHSTCNASIYHAVSDDNCTGGLFNCWIANWQTMHISVRRLVKLYSRGGLLNIYIFLWHDFC